MKIKEIREDLGYSQKQLATLLGVSPSNIYNYENNRTEPSVDMLVKISNALNVSVGELIGVEDYSSNKKFVIKEIYQVNPKDFSEKEKELLKLFNSLSPFEQDGIFIQIQALAKNRALANK